MSNTSNTGTHSNSYKIYNKNLDMKFLRKEIETEVGELSKKQELCSRKNTFFTCKFPSFQRSWSLPSIKRKRSTSDGRMGSNAYLSYHHHVRVKTEDGNLNLAKGVISENSSMFSTRPSTSPLISEGRSAESPTVSFVSAARSPDLRKRPTVTRARSAVLPTNRGSFECRSKVSQTSTVIARNFNEFPTTQQMKSASSQQFKKERLEESQAIEKRRAAYKQLKLQEEFQNQLIKDSERKKTSFKEKHNKIQCTQENHRERKSTKRNDKDSKVCLYSFLPLSAFCQNACLIFQRYKQFSSSSVLCIYIRVCL